MSTFRIKNTKETKGGINAEEARNKRMIQKNQVRTQEREAILTSRRRRGNNLAPEILEGEATVIDEEALVLDIPKIPELVQALHSPEDDIILPSISHIRQLVSISDSPPYDQVIQAGGLPILIQLLAHQNDKIVFEAAWCLTNIASGTSNHTKLVVKAGAIHEFVRLLDSENVLVRDQAVWAIGNIAGESTIYRDLIIELGAIPKLLTISHMVLRLIMLRNVSWTLSNLCRGRNPPPKFEIVSQVLPTLTNMINFRDPPIVGDAIWCLSFLSDNTEVNDSLPDNHKIEVVLQSGCLPRIIQLLTAEDPNISTPALRTIGNILTGSHTQTQIVLSAGALPVLISLLGSPRKTVRREAVWALSNIAAGTPDQIDLLITQGVFTALFHLVQTADIMTKREIVWAICNALSKHSPHVLHHIASIGWINGLIFLLGEEDSHLVICTLDCLHHFLECGERNKITQGVGGSIKSINVYAEIIDRTEGDKVLTRLLEKSENDLIYNKTLALLQGFLGYESSEPQEYDDNQFQMLPDGMVSFPNDDVNQDAHFDF